MDIYERFEDLIFSEDEGFLSAVMICSKGEHFLAKNKSGTPVFLISQSDNSLYQPDIKLRHFSAIFNVECKVVADAKSFDGVFCVIEFDDFSSDLFQVFIRCISAGILTFEKKLTILEIVNFVSQLTEMFRLLNSPSDNEISGLWSELFTIKNSLNPKNGVRYWHDDKFSRFDFIINEIRIEVKSTLSQKRIHNFSLEQLSSSDDHAGYVISYLLQSQSNGIGIIDLAKEIELDLDGDHYLKNKLWANVIKTLGSDFSKHLDSCFDENYAKRNVKILNFNLIPKPDTHDDNRITSVSFVSDLSDVKPGEGSFINISDLFR